MEKPHTIYAPEKERQGISLTPEQKDAVRQITMGIEEVDESVRSMAVEDVIRTLENGHPLNRIITRSEGDTMGYIACEDFVPNEAYIKYFGTTGQTGRNLLREIPAFLEYAKQHGYSKISFHGWNDRLNHILARYGFERQRTDTWAGFNIDFYEKVLAEQQPQENVEQARRKAFEEKYLLQLNQKYQQTLAGFSSKAVEGQASVRQQKERDITAASQTLSSRLASQPDFIFGEIQQAVLKLKLARHFQQNETVDVNTLFDAIIESPKFITNDKGSLHRLLEVHEEKTLQKIADIRKRRAEMTGQEGLNPYENLFTTASGNYCMVRLLNMPHLEQESEYMQHCVGTSDSYVNQMKRGEIEILSFRHVPKINPFDQKFVDDAPVMTIEYNLKTKTVEQMKKANDDYLRPDDAYFNDVLDALKQLRATQTDAGEPRDFKKIAPSELENFKVKDYHILTENGEVSFRNFNLAEGVFVLKMGSMEITPDISKQDAVKIIKLVENIDCKAEHIATSPEEVTKSTTVYIGQLTPNILQSDIEHIYSSFPESKMRRASVEIGGKTAEQLEQELERAGFKISDYARDMLRSGDFTTQQAQEKLDLVRLTVGALGFGSGATTEQIYNRAEELGLELCPAEVGPHYRLQYKDQPMNEWLRIAMKQISGRSRTPDVFDLGHNDDGLWLNDYWASPTNEWSADDEFVFRLRKSKT